MVPVVIVCLGLLGGGVVGAVCGFFAGLLLDSLLLQTLGVSSLVLLSIGYLAGRYREGFEISQRHGPGAARRRLHAARRRRLRGDRADARASTPRSACWSSARSSSRRCSRSCSRFAVYPLVRRALGAALVDYQPEPAA